MEMAGGIEEHLADMPPPVAGATSDPDQIGPPTTPQRAAPAMATRGGGAGRGRGGGGRCGDRECPSARLGVPRRVGRPGRAHRRVGGQRARPRLRAPGDGIPHRGRVPRAGRRRARRRGGRGGAGRGRLVAVCGPSAWSTATSTSSEATATLSEGTLAYYDPSGEQVFVRGTELTPAVRVTLAHELAHVLQDQHFDLERLADQDFAGHGAAGPRRGRRRADRGRLRRGGARRRGAGGLREGVRRRAARQRHRPRRRPADALVSSPRPTPSATGS